MLRLIAILSLFFCSQAYAQQFYAGVQYGLLNKYEVHVGAEVNRSDVTFGARIALGSYLLSSLSTRPSSNTKTVILNCQEVL